MSNIYVPEQADEVVAAVNEERISLLVLQEDRLGVHGVDRSAKKNKDRVI